jgi:uncharacterized protein (TIGR01777 family)
MAKRVIITGATGFIGRALSERLVETGYDVVGLSRDPERGRQLLGDRITILGWDGRSAKGWGGHADGAYAVINLAGESIASGRWTKQKKRSILESRLDAGKAVSDAVAESKNKPRVFIQSSGSGYYGSRGDEIVDESCSSGEGFLPDVAEQWEQSTKGVESLAVRHVIIRTGIVLGSDGGALPRLLTPFRFFVGGPLGSGQQYFPWIHIADEVDAIRFLMEGENLQGAFNLSAPDQLTQKNFCRILGTVMKRPSWLPVPAVSLRAIFGEMARDVLLSGQRALPKRLLEAGYSFQYPTAKLALQHILSSETAPS